MCFPPHFAVLRVLASHPLGEKLVLLLHSVPYSHADNSFHHVSPPLAFAVADPVFFYPAAVQ